MTSLGEVITSSTGALSEHSPSPRLDAELLTGHALALRAASCIRSTPGY